MSNKQNYLDYIPKKTDKIQWRELDNRLIQIIKPRNSLLDKVVRKLFFTPDKFVIDLDEIGSFIWKQDGKKYMKPKGKNLVKMRNHYMKAYSIYECFEE